MHESESEDEDLDGIHHSSRGNGIASRVKLEQLNSDAELRLKHGLDGMDKTRTAVSLVLQQQMAAVAMSSLIAGSATQWTPSLPPASPGTLSITAPATHVSGPAPTQVISSSSPSGGSGSSGSGNSGSHLEAGKGYTFEEQFKQVSL